MPPMCWTPGHAGSFDLKACQEKLHWSRRLPAAAPQQPCSSTCRSLTTPFQCACCAAYCACRLLVTAFAPCSSFCSCSMERWTCCWLRGTQPGWASAEVIVQRPLKGACAHASSGPLPAEYLMAAAQGSSNTMPAARPQHERQVRCEHSSGAPAVLAFLLAACSGELLLHGCDLHAAGVQ